MKTLICVEGEWYYMDALEPVRDDVLYLSNNGAGAFHVGCCKGDPRWRHPLTPADPSDKHVVAMKLGLELYDRLDLEKHSGQPMEIMKKSERLKGTKYINLETGYVCDGSGVRDNSLLCIALAPEPVEKTTEDHLRAVLSVLDTAIVTSDLYEVRRDAQAHLDKTNDPGA